MLRKKLVHLKGDPIDGYLPNMTIVFDFEELIRIATFEYRDTQSMTDQKIYSMEEVLDFLKVEKRNKDIECILS